MAVVAKLSNQSLGLSFFNGNHPDNKRPADNKSSASSIPLEIQIGFKHAYCSLTNIIQHTHAEQINSKITRQIALLLQEADKMFANTDCQKKVELLTEIVKQTIQLVKKPKSAADAETYKNLAQKIGSDNKDLDIIMGRVLMIAGLLLMNIGSDTRLQSSEQPSLLITSTRPFFR